MAYLPSRTSDQDRRMRLSRRSFLAWAAGLWATLGWSRNNRLGASTIAGPAPTAPRQGALLDAALLAALGDVMLPSELGADGIRRVTRAFSSWITAYREGAEIVHPYGSAEIEYTPPSPASRWRVQLATLDRAAREGHSRAFTALTRAEREALVRSALAAERVDRLPDPLAANHVAVALAAFYFSSSDAHDLSYRVRIGRRTCRPLVNSPREPLPLATPGARS
jgi:hypothetical protein